ncbi:MAG TPA: iron uptake porin [Nostocaceae cyanobacterium]|nr:iron uptake porin [Nostocaceae cyanobacterium]
MSNILWKSLVVSPAVLGATLLVSTTAIAAPNATNEVILAGEQAATQPEVLTQASKDSVIISQVQNYSNENNSISQVTSVSQFSDVQPTDWAFQALQSLVERYGCIAGYPNGTYRGNRALTRYEFAAGLNACLDRVNELIATATADAVTREDLATLQRLQEEFSAELATLRGRVDSLEARTAELEANQFSTTTKLQGEAVFAVSDAFGGQTSDVNNTVFQDRVRLSLQSSFTGRDLLTTRLAAGNAQAFTLRDNNADIATAEGTQTYQVGGETGNSVNIDRLTYQAPIGPGQVYLAATGGRHSHYAAVNNPYFFDQTDGGNGALSTFASEAPIYRIGGGAGIALNLPFGQGGGILRPSSVTLGYMAGDAENPGINQGLFNGNYAALGQLNFSVGDRIGLAATYVHGYHGAGSTLFDHGLGLGNSRAFVGTQQANSLGVNLAQPGATSASNSSSYALSAAIRPSDKLSISGFVSYHDVTGFGSGDDFEAWSYGLGIALPDFGKQGNVLGIYAGAEPYARNRVAGSNEIPYHIEGFYKYRLSDNISVTPGVIWLTAPGQSNNNDDAFIGTLRTTFTF